ncbi:N-acetylmuramoyl-L-alanine amidase [Anaerotalea alkaliphila]|uniref:AMIN domain-containing protein n=1 Tax=Anaerotalea alkaliphila TaxID=2662126 RepID=A0A7X5HV45_9FIRM|nr:N-acetylmuramoyl-L-alanine amidase [Anaerotalea alkaliphila]NDL67212.1 AMIN domain-containing protein [Anaerotalea alkaliphila]
MRRAPMIWLLVFCMLLGTLQPVSGGEVRPGFKIKMDGVVQAYSARTVTVQVAGKDIPTGDMPAIILDGRTLVPLREVFESDGFGAKVAWNADKKEATVTYGSTTIVMAIDSTTAYVDGKPQKLDVAPKLVQDVSDPAKPGSGKTMIPLRFVSEQLGHAVSWDPGTYTAGITPPVPEPEPAPAPESPVVAGDGAGDPPVLVADGAHRSLPTALLQAPVIWSAGTGTAAPSVDRPSVESGLEARELDPVELQAVEYSLKDGKPRFEVRADGPISRVDHLVLDKKVVLDVVQAKNALGNRSYGDNPVATAIRTSQYAETPPTTRMVFDLKENAQVCTLSLSADRKTLVVEFAPKAINRIVLGQNDKGDYIQVEGMAPTGVDSFRLSGPDRIVFDLTGTKSAIGKQEAQAQGQFVLGIRTDQFTETTTRIVAVMDGTADYTVTRNGSTTLIQFMASTLTNVQYTSSGKNPLIGLGARSNSIDLAGVRYVDDYEDGKFTVVLPGDYSQVFGAGDLAINDSSVGSIELVQDSAGRTNIVVRQKEYYEFRLEEAEDGYQLKGYKPRELYSRIVVVDAGHGGSDPGATAGSVKEKALNLSMALYLKAHFDASGDYKVYYTRTTDVYKTLQYRADLANTVGADLFISIHNNATSSSSVNGLETLYMPGGTVDVMSSIAAARIFQDNLVPATGMANRGLKSREGLYVLRNTKMPAVLLEIGFMSNAADLSKLVDASFQKKAAAAMFEAAEKVFVRFPTGR